MKRFVTKYLAYIILAATVVMLVPGITNRISNEGKNNNITISVLYNDLQGEISEKKLSQTLEEYKKMGVDTVSVMEEDLNYLVSNGDVTSIKYNVLRHKYDEQSMKMADFIAEKCPDISYDSHVIIASRDEAKKNLKYMLPRKFSEKEYADIGSFEDLDIYVMYDGRKELWDYAIGYNEETIEEIKSMGFNIALVHKVKNYPNLKYLEDIDRIIKKYDVEYFNIKAASEEYKDSEVNEGNYKGISEIINKNDMTLVVTEETDHLSNQKCLGYAHIYNETIKEGGTKKVVRSYETYDDSQKDETNYKYRVEQIFNSTIDRNIRFVTVTQIAAEGISYDDCVDYTLKAIKTYKDKVEKLGYTTNGTTNEINYSAARTLNSALCAVIMVLCLLLMYEMITGKKSFILTIAAVALAALAFVGTFVLPQSLVLLYPTVFCVVQSCMAMTAVLYFVKIKADKLPEIALIFGAVTTMLFVLLIGAVGMGTMLSGLDYYINNLIFRGIKISLIIPILYTMALYYLMFVKNSEASMLSDMKKALTAEIKVYWMLLAVAVAGVGVYYIIRSGNVSSISGLEKAMRSAITELFPARPRTKEFLIGYPALVLFVYYAKHSNIQVIKWLLAIAASILAASVTNSFCHVFTDFSVILSRTLNGLLAGAIVSVIAYIANLILIKALKVLKRKFEL